MQQQKMGCLKERRHESVVVVDVVVVFAVGGGRVGLFEQRGSPLQEIAAKGSESGASGRVGGGTESLEE